MVLTLEGDQALVLCRSNKYRILRLLVVKYQMAVTLLQLTYSEIILLQPP
jgi:hypothetical protein